MLPNNLVEVRDNHKFDLKKLNKWFRNFKPEYGKILSVKQFVGGQSNPTFVISFKDQEGLILRKKPPGKIQKYIPATREPQEFLAKVVGKLQK